MIEPRERLRFSDATQADLPMDARGARLLAGRDHQLSARAEMGGTFAMGCAIVTLRFGGIGYGDCN
jgi:hypothetical protein